MKKREPCSTCLWRVGVDAWAIGRDHTPEVPPLNYEEMVSLAERQGTGLHAAVMACHLTFRGEEKLDPNERVCVGFALRASKDNLLYRIACLDGSLDPTLFERPEVPLHESFEAMLAANPPREDDEDLAGEFA